MKSLFPAIIGATVIFSSALYMSSLFALPWWKHDNIEFYFFKSTCITTITDLYDQCTTEKSMAIVVFLINLGLKGATLFSCIKAAASRTDQVRSSLQDGTAWIVTAAALNALSVLLAVVCFTYFHSFKDVLHTWTSPQTQEYAREGSLAAGAWLFMAMIIADGVLGSAYVFKSLHGMDQKLR